MVANSQNILSSDTRKVAEKYRRCSMESYYSKRYYFILFQYCEKKKLALLLILELFLYYFSIVKNKLFALLIIYSF